MNYEQLKQDFENLSKEGFGARYGSRRSTKLKVINTLTDQKNDGEYSPGILRALNSELSDALRYWSASGDEDVRRDQETDNVILGSIADKLQENFCDFPLWKNCATHVSNASKLYD